MKKIDVSQLSEGMVAEGDYRSDKGELLVRGGDTITQRHLDLIRRRNIFEMHVQTEDDDEIESLLSKEIEDLDELDLDTAETSRSTARKQETAKQELAALNKSERAMDLDRALKKQAVSDRPVGPALKDKASCMTVADRTEEYKSGVVASYETALAETTNLLNMLAADTGVSGKTVRSIVERFVDIFITDRNILLALSGVKHTGRDYIYNHCLNVCLLSINIAAAFGYSRSQVIEIGMGALLHDIGMLLISSSIRTKKGKLSQEEWFEVQKHPVLGLHQLEKVKSLPGCIPFVAYQVHERENAVGYPKKRHSVLIHRFAKVVQLADIYEAMTSPRSYRTPLAPYNAMAQIIKMARTGLISGEYVKALLEYISLFPVGSLVQLSDGRIARVVQANSASPAKPLLSVLTTPKGELLSSDRNAQVDLHAETTIQVAKALPSDFLGGLRITDGF